MEDADMIKKLVMATAAMAVAISFAPSASFAKRMKVARCTEVGAMCTKKLGPVGKVTGWADMKTCYPNGKMYLALATCYVPSGTCPRKC
jgi:hypothetical protein